MVKSLTIPAMKKRLSEEIEELLKDLCSSPKCSQEITVGRFTELVSHRGFGMLLLLFSLPSALPVPAPGYSMPFGIIIILLALQMILGRSAIWLPDKICQKQVPPRFITILRQKGVPFLARVEKWLSHRMEFVTQRTFLRPVGIIILLMGALMMIPIPLTNTLPAMVVFIVGLGLSTDDGLFILGGLVVGVIALVVCLTIASLAIQIFR